MNIRWNSLFSVGLLGLLCLMLPQTARADNFTFSFTGTYGTVTGEIFGLTNNTTGAATDVTITSFPGIFLSDPLLAGSAVTDLFSGQWNILENTFTESSGAINSYVFTCNDINGTTFILSIGYQAGILEIAYGATDVGPVSFVPSSPVAAPEPASFGLMLFGLMALVTLVEVRTQKTGQALQS
ncbi:MAG TPA: hypothetical protein VL099_04890 [Candidatus Binatia bacterium]|nr:hypothetical protein [Candidatus Binatia bacterium]